MKLALTGPLLFVLLRLTSAVVVHIYVPELFTWSDALEHCRLHYTDMSYITSEADHNVMTEAAGANFTRAWIGLYRQSGNPNNWMWSSGYAYQFSKLDYVNDANFDCVYADKTAWKNDLCEDELPFFCYDNFDLSLVTANKTWEEALEYCRSDYTELVSATSQFHFSLLSVKEQNSTTSGVWIGLRFLAGKWIWVSRSFRHITFNGLLSSCPAEPYHCAAHNKITGKLENRDCEQKLNFVCY